MVIETSIGLREGATVALAVEARLRPPSNASTTRGQPSRKSSITGASSCASVMSAMCPPE